MDAELEECLSAEREVSMKALNAGKGIENPHRHLIETLTTLFSHPDCELATSAARKREFRALVVAGYLDQAGKRHDSAYQIECAGNQVAILVLSPDSLPVCYANDQLIVWQERAGHLAVLEGGSVGVQLKPAHEAPFIEWKCRYDAAPGRSNVVLDVNGVFRTLTRSISGLEVNPKTQTLVISSEGTLALLELRVDTSGKSNGFPIKSLSVSGGPRGDRIAISSIQVGPGQPFIPLSISRADLDRLGLPINAVHHDQPSLPPELLAPPDFGRDKAERAAAEKILALLRSYASQCKT